VPELSTHIDAEECKLNGGYTTVNITEHLAY
jgi:hypothetical protein